MEIKDVENLAELARLELSDEEKRSLLFDMESILAYVRQVEEVDVSENPEEHALRNVWREDEPGGVDFSRELILGQFPEREGDYLKVKKIL